jgi:hypothetical protein
MVMRFKICCLPKWYLLYPEEKNAPFSEDTEI